MQRRITSQTERMAHLLSESFQVPVDLYFGIDSGKEITKVGSLQHALSL